MDGILLIVGVAILLVISSRIEKKKKSEYVDFDLAGMNEKLNIADETRKGLNAMEELATDIQTSSPDLQIVIHLTWVSHDGEPREYDLYIDGCNTASDAMNMIIEREINDLRTALAYECAALSYETRSRKSDRKNVIQKAWEWLNDGKDVRDVWQENGDR